MRLNPSWFRLASLLLLLALFLGCVDPVTAPTGLSYKLSAATYTRGTAIAANMAALSGQKGTTFQIAPALPAGLAMDSATGTISGTPTALAPTATYTVTASNSAGSTTCTLNLAVNDVPPANLVYPTSPALYTAGTAIAANTPAVTGGTVVAYSVAPVLPAGLALNATTGELTGTPTVVAAAKDYVITATNSGGSTTATLNLTVAGPPLVLTTPPANQAVLVGQVARFAVAASGSGTLTYQWLKNGAPISGATSPTCLTPVAVPADSGALFTVAVSDTYGTTITSAAATLTVTIQPTGTSSLTGSLITARSFHTATLLTGGKVLVTGGFNGVTLNSAELYDPATFSFAATGTMVASREYHTATLLPSGKVLVAGGSSSNTVVATAELYDPATGAFTATGSMGTARANHTATLLATGKVLIVGGRSQTTTYATAELYDPAAGTFAPAASLASEARATHTATLLPDGQVLVAGGNLLTDLASAERYDPVANLFTPVGSMNAPRAYQTATLLANGYVLMVGGTTSMTAERFNPSNNLFITTGSLAAARHYWHVTVLLATGQVLVAGGVGAGSPAPLLSSAERYDATLGTFTATGSLVVQREAHTATLLPDGRVLIAGGAGGAGHLDSAELYQ
jgi:hypothetical protein